MVAGKMLLRRAAVTNFGRGGVSDSALLDITMEDDDLLLEEEEKETEKNKKQKHEGTMEKDVWNVGRGKPVEQSIVASSVRILPELAVRGAANHRSSSTTTTTPTTTAPNATENGFSFQSQHVGSNHIDTQEPQRVWGDSQVKPGAEVVGRRRNRLGRSTALRKSLAWDKAFFTDEGVLDNDELFAVASNTPKPLPMPELSTIWDDPQELSIDPFEVVMTADNKEANLPATDILTTAIASQTYDDRGLSSSNTVAQAYEANLVLMPTALPGVVKPAIKVNSNAMLTLPNAAEHMKGITSNIKASGTVEMEVQQARSASNFAQHASIEKNSQLRPLSSSQPIHVPLTGNTNKKVEEKVVEQMQRGKPLLRSMSASSLHGSPSSKLSRQVSSMSRKVKDTLGKVISGRGQKASTPTLPEQVLSSGKIPAASKKLKGLPAIPESKGSSNRVNNPSAPAGSEKGTKGVRDMPHAKGGKGGASPPASKDSSTQVPILTRSKSSISVSVLQNPAPSPASDDVPPRTEPPYPAKPTGLRKPSPKIGFFDSARATTVQTVNQPLPDTMQTIQNNRSQYGFSVDKPPLPSSNGFPGKLSQLHQGLPSGRMTSAIPSAPHVRMGVASAPTSPKARLVSSCSQSDKNTRQSPQKGSGSKVAESHSHAGRKPTSGTTNCQPSRVRVQANPSSSKVPIATGSLKASSTPAEMSDLESNTGGIPHQRWNASSGAQSSFAVGNNGASDQEPPRQEQLEGTSSIHANVAGEGLLKSHEPKKEAAHDCLHNSEWEEFRSSSFSNSRNIDRLSPKLLPHQPAEKDCQNPGTKHTWHYGSPSSRCAQEVLSGMGTPSNNSPAAAKYALSPGEKKAWQPSCPSSRDGGGNSARLFSLTPVYGDHGSLIGFNQPTDGTGCSQLLEKFSQAQAVSEQLHATGTGGSQNCTPEGSSKKTKKQVVELESPGSHWSDWPVLGAAVPGLVKGPDPKKEGSKSVSPNPALDQEAELQLPEKTQMVYHGGLMKTPSPKVMATDYETSDRSPLVGLNSADGHGSGKKEKGSLFSFAKKAVSRLTLSPMSVRGSEQENEGTPRSGHRRWSKSSSNACEAELKPPLPILEERICALEAAGPEGLERKNGPVKNSPTDKASLERNPWSPVRKNGRELGPFDCTKLNHPVPT